jgi:hypothetical protein
MPQPRPQLPRAQGADDPVRQRHGGHFDQCEATGRHSGIYFDFLTRDLTPHLLAVLRELETRAAMVLAGEPRRRVLALLYDRQDQEPWRLATFFIQTSDAESPAKLGFGHVGGGRMGITEDYRWQRHLDEFRENIWRTILRESRRPR